MSRACQLTMTVSDRQRASKKKIARKNTIFDGIANPRMWASPKIGAGNIAQSRASSESVSHIREYFKRSRLFTTSLTTKIVRRTQKTITDIWMIGMREPLTSGCEDDRKGHFYHVVHRGKPRDRRSPALALVHDDGYFRYL